MRIAQLSKATTLFKLHAIWYSCNALTILFRESVRFKRERRSWKRWLWVRNILCINHFNRIKSAGMSFWIDRNAKIPSSLFRRSHFCSYADNSPNNSYKNPFYKVNCRLLFVWYEFSVLFSLLCFFFRLTVTPTPTKKPRTKTIMHQNHLRSNWIECEEFKPPI